MPSLPEDLIDLKPDHLLLDANFDGYKLSLESFPTFNVALPSPVRVLQTSNSQFGLEHVKLFGDINYLIYDFHSSNARNKRFYAILDDLSVCSIFFSLEERQFSAPKIVQKLSMPSHFSEIQDRYPASLSFSDEQFAFVADGVGQLSMFDTGIRGDNENWQECISIRPLSDDNGSGAFVVMESRRTDEEKVDVLLHSVATKKDPHSKGLFCNKLFWLTLVCNSGTWRPGRLREVTCEGHLEMATLDSSAENLIVASTGESRFTADFGKPIAENTAEEGDSTMNPEDSEMPVEEEKKAVYVWTQTSEDVTAVFNLAQRVSKHDVKLSLSPSSVHLSLGGGVLLGGRLGGTIDSSASTYTIDGNKLELTLSKSGISSWSELVVGDSRGVYETDREALRSASELLERFTSDSQALGDSGTNQNFNTEQLEDVDMSGDEICKIRWLCGETHCTKQESDITGNTVLFSLALGAEPKSLCLRMDVDGILWSFRSDERKPAVHRATFNAFGYVQASKTQRKFCVCSPDYSYAAIVEAKRHAFIYWQPTSISSDLRNRRSGRHVGDVAKQHLIALSKRQNALSDPEAVSDDIVGVFADNRAIFILTICDLFAILLKEPEES